MKRAIITRRPSTNEGTFGALDLQGGPMLRCTELPWHDNEPWISCIPKGTYHCELVDSPAKGLVYEIKDVPGRSHILIHLGNWGGDKSKGFRSDLLGCIAPAMALGSILGQSAGVDSAKAMHALMEWSGGEPFELEIR
jgi:hypothetical protein